MDRCRTDRDGEPCPERVVCRCLKVTEGEVVSAIITLGLRTVKEVRQCTGAGDGCTACHRALRECLDRHSSPSAAEPICSVR
jgi:nitrite reductase (NADH) large subunit